MCVPTTGWRVSQSTGRNFSIILPWQQGHSEQALEPRWDMPA